MNELIIIGAGGYGREVYAIAMGLQARGAPWKVKGFLDDRSGLLDGLAYDHPILGPVEEYEPTGEDLFVCALGDPATRRRYTEKILARGGRMANLFHWTSLATERISWGVGCVVGPFCALSCEIRIGDSVFLNSYATIGHDVEIGSYCQLQSFSFVGGGARIGDGVTLQPHSVVLAGARVADGAVVGAGSVALRRVAANTTVFGVPATTLAFRDQDESV
jgi:sugar O-acyltransferase (sialic acid O-acetyltransferase NeuD family)